MADVAIVKPDHLGDFILSIPALRALHDHFDDIDLLIAPEVGFLQRYFLPRANVIPVSLQHLNKSRGGLSADELVERLRAYALVIFLRDDHVIRYVADRLPGLVVIPDGALLRHETEIQRIALSSVLPRYSRSHYFPHAGQAWPSAFNEVGLCISAGFFTNSLPITSWRALGRAFRDSGVAKLRLIGGPKEEQELNVLARLLDLDKDAITSGSTDLAQFFAEVMQCDIVIGTDSGTLHMVSCVRPVLGLFTSSPWWRFAPFGRHQRIVTADVVCSPCVQFSHNIINACLARECGALITPRLVVEAASLVLKDPEIRELQNLKAIQGPSHLSLLESEQYLATQAA